MGHVATQVTTATRAQRAEAKVARLWVSQAKEMRRFKRKQYRVGGGDVSSIVNADPFLGFGLSKWSCIQHDGMAYERRLLPSER